MPAVRIIAVLLFALVACSCSVTQYLPEGEYLYRGSTVEVAAADSIETAELLTKLNATLRNRSNSKTPLIGYRGIWRYYKHQEKIRKNPDKEKLREKEVGEEPIFYSPSVVESVSDLLENRAANSGYFTHNATFETDTLGTDPPEISVKYTVSVGEPYRLDTVQYYWADSSIARILNGVRDKSVLKPGDRYDLDRIKAERGRWEQALRRNGYYYARAEDYLFLADTVSGDHRVRMLAKLKDDLPPERLQPQTVARVDVYPNADPADTLLNRRLPVQEAGGVHVHCAECTLRPAIVDEAFALREGDRYNPGNHSKTLKRLANYNTFRYISMAYEPLGSSDSLLRLEAYLQPLLRRRIEAEAGLTYNNANYVGPNLSVAYVNRNLLRGAELLRIEGELDYAVYTGAQESARVNRSAAYGLTATLGVPRLWLPKRRKLIPRVITSSTTMQLSAKLLDQSLNLRGFADELDNFAGLKALLEGDGEATEALKLLTARAKYGYNWQRRVTKQHQLFPFSIHIQDPRVDNAEVLALARSQGLGGGGQNVRTTTSRYDRMIAYSPGYTLTYDSRLRELRTHNLFWQQYLSMNWNNVFPVGQLINDGGRVSSIYPQVETDLRYYFNLTRTTQLASRVHGGVAYPITDRAIVPFFDLYTIGGPNSLRGFSPLSLGPGRTVPLRDPQLSSGGFGNLILEGSVEVRQRINSLFEVAAFIDAGNIWTYRTELEPLDTDFRRESFLDELAMDAGAGVRVDLQFLILRVDLAYPFQRPYEDAAAQDPDIELPPQNLNLVLAFGYPF